MYCLLRNYYVSLSQSIRFVQFQVFCDPLVVLIPTSLNQRIPGSIICLLRNNLLRPAVNIIIKHCVNVLPTA